MTKNLVNVRLKLDNVFATIVLANLNNFIPKHGLGSPQIMVEICTNVRLLAYSTANNLRASSQIQTVSRLG